MKPLGDRAKYRLRIAAHFLRARGRQFPKDGDFYGRVLEALEQQSDRDAIKEWVDWVEDYDHANGEDHPTTA